MTSADIVASEVQRLISAMEEHSARAGVAHREAEGIHHELRWLSPPQGTEWPEKVGRGQRDVLGVVADLREAGALLTLASRGLRAYHESHFQAGSAGAAGGGGSSGAASSSGSRRGAGSQAASGAAGSYLSRRSRQEQQKLAWLKWARLAVSGLGIGLALAALLTSGGMVLPVVGAATKATMSTVEAYCAHKHHREAAASSSEHGHDEDGAAGSDQGHSERRPLLVHPGSVAALGAIGFGFSVFGLSAVTELTELFVGVAKTWVEYREEMPAPGDGSATEGGSDVDERAAEETAREADERAAKRAAKRKFRVELGLHAFSGLVGMAGTIDVHPDNKQAVKAAVVGGEMLLSLRDANEVLKVYTDRFDRRNRRGSG